MSGEPRSETPAREDPYPPIAFVDLKRQYQALRPEILEAVERVCGAADFVLGVELQRFEEEFAALAGARHVVGVGSGTGALVLALKAAGIGAGDEVIAPANTFISTVLAITHAGARPVLADVNPDTHLLEADEVARRLTRRTKAVIPVHLFGQTADVEAIRRVLRRSPKTSGRVLILEDACQAHGAALRGRPAGSLGDLAAFSFYPGKNLGAYGEGGAVATGSASWDTRLRALRNIGQKSKNLHAWPGYNERLDTLQAAILRVKLRRLAGWNESRRAAARLYASGLADSPVAAPVEAKGNRHVYHLYVIRAPRRDALAAHLRERRIATGIHYPRPVHRQPCYAGLKKPRGSFPHAEKAASEILSLPMFPEIRPDEIDRVCREIHAFYKSPPGRNAGRAHREVRP
jgi:dTDP-4-amino-4,6-dideoxygalactose transaminase